MRPDSIVWFERLFLLSLPLPFLVGFTEFRAMWSTFGPVVGATLLVLFLILPATLALLVSRRRSRVALIFLILVTWPLGLLAVAVLVLLPREALMDVAQFLSMTLPTAVTLLLLAPRARAWLTASRTAPVSTEALGRRFE